MSTPLLKIHSKHTYKILFSIVTEETHTAHVGICVYTFAYKTLKIEVSSSVMAQAFNSNTQKTKEDGSLWLEASMIDTVNSRPSWDV